MSERPSIKVKLENIRCSYVFIKDTNKHGSWSIQPLIPKDSEAYKTCQRAVKKVLTEAKGADAWKKRGMYKLPLRDGDSEREGDEYAGHYFFNANSKKRQPQVLGPTKKEATDADFQKLGFSGCHFHISVNFYYFPAQEGSKAGVAVGLNNIMLYKPGERLDGSTSASEDFEEFSAGEEVADDDLLDDPFGDDPFDDDDL